MKQITIEINGSGTLDQIAIRLLEIGRALQIFNVHGGDIPTGESNDLVLTTKIEVLNSVDIEYLSKKEKDTKDQIMKIRLEYLRGELRAERISMGELIELQSLKDYIEEDDVELLEAAGVPEFQDNDRKEVRE